MTELRTITSEPANASTVTLLENALALARAGALSSVGLAMVRRDGSVDAEWSEVPSLPALIGAAARLEHRLHVLADDRSLSS